MEKSNNIKQLVERSQNGDSIAFEELVTLYQDKIYGLSYHLTGNYADAQDLAQEAFVKAFYSIKSFRNEADFGTWVHRITVNLWLNIAQKRKKQQAFSLDAPVETQNGEMERMVAATTEGPEEITEQKELRELVWTAMKNMTQEHKSVLVLREVYGYSYDEISGILKCSPGTVRSRLNRARRTLQDKLLNLSKQMGFNLNIEGRSLAGDKK